MKAIDLAGFADKFARNTDPWNTWSDADEALKRTAILHALGAGPLGRILELGAGNGSNSALLARRALRLDATEGTEEGTGLVARAISERAPRARALRLVVPERPPRPRYDAVVVAELLYYLDHRAMRALAADLATRLRPNGVLVLAHHRITFYDFVQHAEFIHRRFLAMTGVVWQVRTARRTGRWIVLSCRPG